MSRYLKRYKGEWWDEKKLDDSDSKIVANFVFSTVASIAPLLTDNRPIWSARARDPILDNYVDAFSLALEYLWDKLDMDQTVYKWVLDALIFGTGIVKCWYDPEEEESVIEVVDPRTFFIAPGYDDLWKAPFCGVRKRMPLSWIWQAFPAEKAKQVKPDSDDDSLPEDEWAAQEKMVTVDEVFIRDSSMEKVEADGEERPVYPHGRLLTYTKDVWLGSKASPFQHGKPHYVALRDYNIPHEFWGMGEVEQIEDMCMSFNRNLQLMDKWTQYYCDPPWLYDVNAGLGNAETVKKQLKQGGGFFGYNSGTVQSPDHALHKLASTSIDPTIITQMSAITKLIEEMSGVTDITKGMSVKSQRQSATEISTLLESSYTRTRQRVRNLEDAIKRLLYLKMSNMMQFYSEPRQFSRKLEDENGIERTAWPTISNQQDFAKQTLGSPTDAKTDEEAQEISDRYKQFAERYGNLDRVYAAFDLEIQTNSTLPMDKQSLANLFLRLLEMAAGSPETAMPMWKATLAALHVPRHKEIISEMQEMIQQSQQAQAPPPVPGGVPDMVSLMREGAA